MTRDYNARRKTQDDVARMELAIATLDRADKAYDTVEQRQMAIVQEGFERILSVLPGSTVVTTRRIQRDFASVESMLFSVRVQWYPPADVLKIGGVTPGKAVQTWLDRLNDLTIAHVFTEGHWKWNDNTTSANGIEQTFIAWYRLYDANVEPDVLDIKHDEDAILTRLRDIFGNGDLEAQEPGTADEGWTSAEPDEGIIGVIGPEHGGEAVAGLLAGLDAMPKGASKMTPTELLEAESLARAVRAAEGRIKTLETESDLAGAIELPDLEGDILAPEVRDDIQAAIDAEMERMREEIEASTVENPYLPEGYKERLKKLDEDLHWGMK